MLYAEHDLTLHKNISEHNQRISQSFGKSSDNSSLKTFLSEKIDIIVIKNI